MKKFNPIKHGLLTASAVAVLAVTVAAVAREEEVKLEQCPAAVQKTIQTNAGDGAITEIEKETKKDGTVVYEAEVKQEDGSEIEITVAANGDLIKVESEDDDDGNDDGTD